MSKVEDYKRILSEIAEERDLKDLANHIRLFSEIDKDLSKDLGADIYPYKMPKDAATFPVVQNKETERFEPAREDVNYSGLSSKSFNITRMPEATCDGCQ